MKRALWAVAAGVAVLVIATDVVPPFVGFLLGALLLGFGAFGVRRWVEQRDVEAEWDEDESFRPPPAVSWPTDM